MSAGSAWIGVLAPKPFRVVWSKKKFPSRDGAPVQLDPVVKQTRALFTRTRTNGPAASVAVVVAPVGTVTPDEPVLISIVKRSVPDGSATEPFSSRMPGRENVGRLDAPKLAAIPFAFTSRPPERLLTSTMIRSPARRRKFRFVTAIATEPFGLRVITNSPPSDWPRIVSVVAPEMRKPAGMSFGVCTTVVVSTSTWSWAPNVTPGTSIATSAANEP